MRRVFLAVVSVALVAGCGRVPPAPLAAGDFRLYEAASSSTAQMVAVISSRSQATEARLPMGALSPDGNHLYALRSRTLNDIDPRSGAVLRTLQLPGAFEMPRSTLGGIAGGLSQNGLWLVLQTSGTSSHMVLVNTHDFAVTSRIDLDGDFEFDAITNDGQRLYVIEYTNITQGYYRVRVYDIAAGQLGAYTVIDKGGIGAPEPMTGVRLSGVFSPDGQWLYSVYARQSGGAFVHALNLDQPYAFCLDLPGAGAAADPNDLHWSLALTADGKHLYAANGAMGLVTQIDNLDGYNPSIVRTGHIGSTGSTANSFVQDAAAKELGAQGAVLSPDGATLVIDGSKGLIWIDTARLQARSRQLTSWTVWSLLASRDGTRIYALNDAGAIAELSMADGRTAATFNPAAGSPIGLLRVETA